jgi:hypothetical protein
MANPRYNSQVTQPRGTKARVGKMGGGMMRRPMMKAGGRIAGAARRAQQHGYYTPDMGMKGGKMYAKGGKVSGKKKIMAVGRGKAKDYPGIKKLIEMNKKGKKRFRDGGSALKQVKPSQKGLKKLPTKVRNKMGYMKKGGRVGEMMYSRGYGEGMKSKRKPTELMDRGAMKKGGRVHKNTRRMNRLEELGRVDAEKGRTRKGKRNLRDEKKRIVRELKK